MGAWILDDEEFRRVLLYGTCEDCGAPRDVAVTDTGDGGRQMDLICPACASR